MFIELILDLIGAYFNFENEIIKFHFYYFSPLYYF